MKAQKENIPQKKWNDIPTVIRLRSPVLPGIVYRKSAAPIVARVIVAQMVDAV